MEGIQLARVRDQWKVIQCEIDSELLGWRKSGELLGVSERLRTSQM